MYHGPGPPLFMDVSETTVYLNGLRMVIPTRVVRASRLLTQGYRSGPATTC